MQSWPSFKVMSIICMPRCEAGQQVAVTEGTGSDAQQAQAQKSKPRIEICVSSACIAAAAKLACMTHVSVHTGHACWRFVTVVAAPRSCLINACERRHRLQALPSLCSHLHASALSANSCATPACLCPAWLVLAVDIRQSACGQHIVT